MSVRAQDENNSPNWGPTTKLIVGLTLVAIVAALLIQFRSIIGPLILAMSLSYLMYPLSNRLSRLIHLPWRTSVGVVYVLLIVILIGLSTVAGLAIVQQVQSLVRVIENFVTNLPNLAQELSTTSYQIGPFQYSLSNLNLQGLADQLLPNLQNLLGRVGGLVSSFATGAASTVAWLGFILVVSYFLLAESNQVSGDLIQFDIPGYNQDILKLGEELRQIWNAYVRGQVIIIGLVILIYSILFSILGVRYSVALAIMAGLARFIPYVGPLSVNITLALVAFFQPGNYFGLAPWWFTIMVVLISVVSDQIIDNTVSPKLMGQTLGVHPAAVLIAALVAANLLGVIGLVLAAPVLATVTLILRYVVRKMFDLDPWEKRERTSRPPEIPGSSQLRRLRAWLRLKMRRAPAVNPQGETDKPPDSSP